MEAASRESGQDLLSSRNKDAISAAVIRTLQKHGVGSVDKLVCHQETDKALPCSDKKKTKGTGSSNSRVFGLSLDDEQQERRITECDGRPCYLPRFFVEAIEFLKNHVTTEGLFRKAGSFTRQRALRSLVETGSGLSDTTNPHDVAALLKQYIRELSEPLLTHRLVPLLQDCVRLFTDHRKTESDTLTRSEAIQMTCLLLPTQHLLCLQILFRLLSQIAHHCKESLMDSNSLSVVMAPNVLPPEDRKGKRKGGASSERMDIKRMTCLVKLLIDHAHLIGQVPLIIQELAKEIHEDMIRHKYTNKKKQRNHRRRDSVSVLIRETFSKIRGGGGQKREDSPSVASGDELFNSPDGCGPTASKRVAFDESSDMSDRGASEASPSSSTSFNSVVKKQLFKGRVKKRYSILRGKKNFEKVPLLSSQLSQDELFCGVPSPLLQRKKSSNDLELLSVSPVLSHEATIPAALEVKTVEAGNDVTNATSSYRLVSKVRSTYPKKCTTDCPRIDSSTVTDPPLNTDVVNKGLTNVTTKPGKSDHSTVRKRKQQVHLLRSQSSSKILSGKIEPPIISSSQSDFAVSRKCAHITSSTPVNDRPKKRVGQRRKTDGHLEMRPQVQEPSTKLNDSLETVVNNESYLCAVKEGEARQVKQTRQILHDIGNKPLSSNNPPCTPSSSSAVKSLSSHLSSSVKRASSMNVRYTPLCGKEPGGASSAKDGKLSKRAQQYVVKSQSMSRRGINTARSPWINRKGIQVSEWIV